MKDKKMESDLFDFSMQNTMDLIDGKLSFEKIIMLREIDFSFDYYIDILIETNKG
jgi:hypothetical protein